jgi:hypothetical protein
MEYWRVEVSNLSGVIVVIEPNMLSGKDLTPEDEETIRQAAQHLLAFVGLETD